MSFMADDRTALVTGASRGIGRAIATALGRAGYAVAVNYVKNEQAAQEVVAQITSGGARAIPVRGDVADASDRRGLVEQTLAAFGQIDLLVNNAGVAPDVRADILDATEQSFDRLINTNLKGPYFLTQQVARHMIERKTAGKIVNVTSVSAYTASVNRGDYCVSKAGLAMMTKLYAARLAEHGIT